MAERWQQWMPSKLQMRRDDAYDAAAFHFFTSLYSTPPLVSGSLGAGGRLRGWRWEQARRRIFIGDAFTCRYCGAKDGVLECDHVIPVTRGGSNEDDNLVAACFTCNRSKRTKLLTEWVRCNG